MVVEKLRKQWYIHIEVDKMLYDGNNPVLKIVGVELLSCKDGSFNVAPREYSSLAFRIRGSVTVNGGSREYFVNTNDILYVPQHMGYTANYTDNESLVIHFVTRRDDRDIEVYSFQNGEKLYKMFIQAQLIWKNKDPGFDVYVMAQLYSILGTIFEYETKANLPPYFLKGISYINANYKDRSLSIDAVCAKAGISATMFRQLFKKHYQKTPIEYITDLRLEYARNLIAGGMSVENAAYESGFNDPKYFARVVKRRFSCTPRALKTYGK